MVIYLSSFLITILLLLIIFYFYLFYPQQIMPVATLMQDCQRLNMKSTETTVFIPVLDIFHPVFWDIIGGWYNRPIIDGTQVN